MRPDGTRPTIVGPDDGPATPFPIRLGGEVVGGFGRGSKELGIPTANIPIEGLAVGGQETLDSGIYYGYSALDQDGKTTAYPMVMSLGYNPYYKNTVRSVEVHIMHKFAEDFYGVVMRLCILGFIRPEYDYVSKESLIEDIHTDIKVAERCLARPAYESFERDGYLLQAGKT